MVRQITEEQVDLIVERLIDHIEEANTKYLKSIGASISKIKKLSPSKAQQLVQILKYGGNYDDIVKQISKYTNMSIKEVDDMFRAYSKKDQLFYKQFYEYKNVPFVEYGKNVALQRQTQALANVVKNELYGFTRENVLGYMIKDLDGNAKFMGLRETYNKVLDEALVNASQGKETFDSAMRSILEDLGGSGLRTLEYQSGKSMRLDSAVRMDLKARLKELHNENQKMFGQEFGADGYEISVHLNPAPDHMDAQGRQFSIDEFNKLQSFGTAIDYRKRITDLHLHSASSFRPISELNCYHYIFPIILGVSKPEYSDEQLQKIKKDNEKGFKFDGKHYTNYEGTQLQRQFEKKIREQKDIQILARASGDDELVGKSQKTISILTDKYKELSEVSGLPTKAKRLSVSGYRRIKIQNKG